MNAISKQTSSKLVKKIHDEFNSEVDLLLAEARRTRNHNKEFWSRAEKLKSCGFVNVNEVVIAENDTEVNKNKLFLANAIEYFSVKYPLYKFITEESIIEICKKYKLIYSDVTNYIGHIPDKNLNEISDNSVDINDKTYIIQKNWYLTNDDRLLYHTAKILTINYTKRHQYLNIEPPSRYSNQGKQYTDLTQKPLQIVAPLRDFKLENKKLINFKLFEKPVPDPVVLQSVMYGDKEYFLILSAWGDEASDEMVVNQNMN